MAITLSVSAVALADDTRRDPGADRPADTAHAMSRVEMGPESDRIGDAPHVTDRVRDTATDTASETDRVRDRVRDREIDRRCIDRVTDRTRCCLDRPVDYRVPDWCRDRVPPEVDFNIRHLIWRLIHAGEWEKLFQLLHRLHII
jgi:hypothetical protein